MNAANPDRTVSGNQSAGVLPWLRATKDLFGGDLGIWVLAAAQLEEPNAGQYRKDGSVVPYCRAQLARSAEGRVASGEA